MDERTIANGCIVWKLGGSILRGSRDYERCADRLAVALQTDPATRIVAVVSARYGVTNRLLRQASRVARDTASPEVDLLLATGELQSVAQLSMRLRRRGVNCVGLTPDEIGLRIDASSDHGFTVDPVFVQRRFDEHSVIVVPGFVGTRPAAAGARWVVAVPISRPSPSRRLGARQCELIKDVPGYFTSDPNVDASASHLSHVTYARALDMAATGCDLVQTLPLRHASQTGVDLILRRLDGDARRTTVSESAPAPATTDVGRSGESLYGASVGLAAAAS